MPITNYAGQLRSNEIFSSIFNMILSQHVFSENIADNFTSLLDRATVDGSMYGDTKLYYATNVNRTDPWLGDSEAANLLAINRPADPKCQAITVDQFRIISTTLDGYLTKRAWMDEYSFSQFNAVTLGWLQDTKRVYLTTLFNTYLGTCETEAARGVIDVDLSDTTSGDPLYGLTGNEYAEMEAKLIGRAIADLIVDMTDVSTDFNDYGFLRSYKADDLVFIANSKWVNKLSKIGLPTIFHKDGLIEKLTANVLPARYFGHVTDSTFVSDTTNFTVVSGTNVTTKTKAVRSMIEADYTVTTTTYHVFPGDSLPIGAAIDLADGVAYVEDEDVICKVMVGNAVPVMSSFSTAESFYNSRSLTTNHYLIFSHNTLQHLYNLPLITVEKD